MPNPLLTRPDYNAWLQSHLKEGYSAHPLPGDASFRRYIRVTTASQSFMLMDAPTDKEDCTPFVDISHKLSEAGVRVPRIVIEDIANGYLLLEDFGDTLLSTVLNDSTVDGLYHNALAQLLPLQKAHLSGQAYNFALYDKAKLAAEMQLFNEWFLPQLLNIQVDAPTQAMLEQAMERILTACLAQPTAVVHRDYHCRNLMVLADHASIGVIDFQDAVIGPVTYDAVSLLRDAYVLWSPKQVRQWTNSFLAMLQADGQLSQVSEATFAHWFDMMAIQRHLKILGIFVRLNKRDGKTGYMNDLPLVLAYMVAQTKSVDGLQDFAAWLQSVILPAYVAVLPEHKAKLQQYFAILDSSISL